MINAMQVRQVLRYSVGVDPADFDLAEIARRANRLVEEEGQRPEWLHRDAVRRFIERAAQAWLLETVQPQPRASEQESERVVVGPASPLPPRDPVAGTLVHGMIERELAASGSRLADLGPDAYVAAYEAAEAKIYGGSR